MRQSSEVLEDLKVRFKRIRYYHDSAACAAISHDEFKTLATRIKELEDVVGVMGSVETYTEQDMHRLWLKTRELIK